MHSREDETYVSLMNNQGVAFESAILYEIATSLGRIADMLAEKNGYIIEYDDQSREVKKNDADISPIKHGYWIDIDEQSYTWKIRCSCCDHERSMMSTQGEYPNYCENCGARMVEDER